MATTIEPPDNHHLLAVEGWLELGNPGEADAEWNRVSEAARRHPIALALRWQILARLEDWERAREVGEALIERAPESPEGWLHRAYALRRCRLGGLEQAWEALRPAADRFPEEEIVAYNLACYATQLARPDEGWEWYLRALQISKDPSRIRHMALRDRDLEPLWTRIESLRP